MRESDPLSHYGVYVLRPLVTRFLKFVALLVALMAPQTVAGQDKYHPVDLNQLQSLIRKADKIVVLQDLFKNSKVLFTSTDAKDRDDLVAAIQIVDTDRQMHCMCDGSPIIRLYHQGKLLVQVSNHHGNLLRCSLWSSDIPIKDQGAWLRWFDDRGMDGPRQEVKEDEELYKQQELARKRWEGAMPEFVRPLWDGVRKRGGIIDDIEPFKDAMLRGIPDRTQRIRKIMSWYGSGAGPWTGFPAYEEVPEKMLLQYSITDLVTAGLSASLNTTETEGFARLLSIWNFEKLRPGDLQSVPANLKSQLLEHVMKSEDRDKKLRALHALRN